MFNISCLEHMIRPFYVHNLCIHNGHHKFEEKTVNNSKHGKLKTAEKYDVIKDSQF